MTILTRFDQLYEEIYSNTEEYLKNPYRKIIIYDDKHVDFSHSMGVIQVRMF